MNLDSAIIELLGLDPANASVSSAGEGGCSSASTSKITATLPDGSEKKYFMKSGSGKDAETMFKGVHASMKAIHDVVPTLCPRSYGHGKFGENSSKHFLVTDFLDLSPRFGSSSSSSSAPSLAAKLAKLHTTPAPTPQGYNRPQFGFPATTCCGDTPQGNSYKSSWADFYAENRLMFILKRSEASNGSDRELRQMIETTAYKVVPRLLGDDHLNDGKGVTPVVVHGDLWSGNASKGKLPGMQDSEDVIFDSSAVYAHSEFELGIMNMFGGFGRDFFSEYHKLVPKTEPVEEYKDRVDLYELYHRLNHYAMFGGGYRSGAARIMKGLIDKYGDDY
ncbi:hypothetical protein AAFC00_005828 [Neodothiora populina]|uniref:protein-ribulosamine 3-kinase n=1 Tax=Neodothiora populina TaxID=2781224 RepID=A0ABR3P6M2_9PEZI